MPPTKQQITHTGEIQNLVPETAADMLPPKVKRGSTKKTDIALRNKHATGIRADLTKSVVGFIEAGKKLIAAKDELKHGQFRIMVESDLRMSIQMAEMLMKIARHPILSKSNYSLILPPAWTTLADLARVPDPRLEVCLEDGTIHPGMQRKDVKPLLPAQRKSKLTPVDDDPEPETTPSSSDLDEEDEQEGKAFVENLDKTDTDAPINAYMHQIHGAGTALRNCNAVYPNILTHTKPRKEDWRAVIDQTRDIGKRWLALADELERRTLLATRRKKTIIA